MDILKTVIDAKNRTTVASRRQDSETMDETGSPKVLAHRRQSTPKSQKCLKNSKADDGHPLWSLLQSTVEPLSISATN